MPASESIYDNLAALQPELDKCMRCGFCMAVCPVYGMEETEQAVARGKIAIVDAVVAGELSLHDPRVRDAMFDCLVCKSCMESCPTKVNFDRIVVGLRAALAREEGLPLAKRAIFGVIKHPALLDWAMKAAALAQPLATGQQARLMPKLTTPLRDRVPEHVPVESPRARVAFFTGCSLNYMYPEAGIDLAYVLSENNVEVTIPKAQQCCGTPVFIHGDIETARTLARRNIDIMDNCGADYIITGCGSCGGAWQREFSELLGGDEEYSRRAAYWSTRTYDISTFLVDVIQYRRPAGAVETSVTYHDPCHLKKTMKVARQPREILKSIPGVRFVEMPRPDACCGCGGSYALTHTETSTAIARKKTDDVQATGAETVTTGCPACMMQLTANLGRPAHHFISLLAHSYRREAEAER